MALVRVMWQEYAPGHPAPEEVIRCPDFTDRYAHVECTSWSSVDSEPCSFGSPG